MIFNYIFYFTGGYLNNIYLYLNSRIARNSVSAVDLAKNNPTESNLSFAEKLLAVKIGSTVIKLKKNNGDSFYENRKSKYEMLFLRLSSIKKININKRMNKYLDSPGAKFRRVSDEIYCRIKDSDVLSIKKELMESIEKNKKIECCNDYRNKNIDVNNLSNVYLKNRDLSNAKFTSPSNVFDMKNINVNIDFSNSCLINADLSGVNIDGAIYKNADLTNAKINICMGKYLTDFSKAKLDGAKIYFSDSEFFNSHLDENRYINTPFKIIGTISDKYKEIKISLIRDVIKKINTAEMTNEVPIDSIIKNLLEMSFCMENKIISDFIKHLFEVKCSNKQDRDFDFRMEDKYIITYLNLLSDFSNNKELKDFMLKRNGNFIKLMTLSLYHNDDEIKEKARILYNRYLELDEVKPLVGKVNFSNGYHRINWENEKYNNYILISGNKAMIANHKNITKMLFSHCMECTAKWDNFFIYFNGKYQNKKDINHDVLFNEDFKVFRNNYNISINKIKIDELLSLLNLGSYQQNFQSRWMGKPTEIQNDLTDIEKYKNLSTISEKLLVISDDKKENISLKAEHYEDICSVFELWLLDNKEKSKYLLTLAILFTDYMDNFTLGSYNEERYQILLNYICGLMNKAKELNPELMGDKYTTWIEALSKYDMNNYFKFNPILLKMRKYANKHFEQIYRKIIPLHWLM